MSEGVRHYRGLLKLRGVARRAAETAARSLSDLEKAKSDALAALERLDAVIRKEEAVALGRTDIGFRDFASYLEGASAKRAALLQSCRTLDDEIAAARAGVLEAEIEFRKFDHLAAQFEKRILKSRQKKLGEILDDAGRRGHAQRQTKR